MMYDEDPEDEAQANALSSLAAKGGGSGVDLSQLGDPTKLTGVLQSILDRQIGGINRQEVGAKERFEAAKAVIEDRYRGPTQSEQLFMLSKALLAPRDYRGLGGTIGKISGAFSDISDVERKAREQRTAQLAALQNQYMEKNDSFEVDRANAAAGIVKMASPLLKPKASQQNWSGELQRFVSPDAPAPTQVVVNTKAGLKLTQYTDGTLRLNNPDGSQDIYDPATGKKVGTVPSKGTK